MSKTVDNLEDISRIDAIEVTANAAEPGDATILKDADIGVTVQAYDAGIASHIADDTKHRLINDVGTTTTELFSASKIIADLGGKSDTSHNHTGVYEPSDATILKDADIGVNVQAYDATIVVDADIGINVEAYDATILKDADIGINVQAYDSTIVVDADIGVNVQAFSSVLAATTASFLTADETKLDGIETSATADQTAGEIKTAYESNANTNEFSDAEQTKLSGIETGATADQTLGDLGITSTATEVNYTTDVTSNIQAQFTGKVSSDTTETGTNQVVNEVFLTQAAYDALTPVSTTFYIIVG